MLSIAGYLATDYSLADVEGVMTVEPGVMSVEPRVSKEKLEPHLGVSTGKLSNEQLVT